jgi:predicted enzyme related to lactoylglutathione lyase
MAVLSGVNHITFLTSDLDRLALFYEEVFGAKRVMELRPVCCAGTPVDRPTVMSETAMGIA